MKKAVIPLLAILFLAVIFFPSRASAVSCPNCGGDMAVTGTSAAPQPDCTNAGVYTYQCADCGHVTTVRSGPLGHDYVADPLEDPDCTHGGRVLYVCVRCQDTYTEDTPPLGHDYDAEILQAADCEHGGRIRYVCSRCQDTYEQVTKPLGHDYAAEIMEATCEEDGETVYTCSRCGDTYSEPIPATGHYFETTEKEPTCEKEGKRRDICLNCGLENTTVLPALGHDYVYTVTDPTCIAAGEKKGECSRCGARTSETLPAIGHSFTPWAVVKEPTVLKEGEQERHCTVCGLSETQALPKKTPLPIIIISTVLLGGGTAAALIIPKAVTAAKTASAAPGMITLQLKHVLSLLPPSAENRRFETFLKKKKFIDLKKPGQVSSDPDPEKGKRYQPDLVLIQADSLDSLTDALAAAKERYGDANIGVLAEDSLGKVHLDAAVADKSVFAYAYRSYSESRRLVRLIMPLYKPSESSGNYAENATLITGAMGLPFLSVILNAYVVGGDIKEAIEKRGMSKAETADLINDIAGLFGLEALANITEALRISADQGQRVKDNEETGK
ncbi:MAG: hypothetical protein J6P48_00060 [Oscillospiraceae bacterium]|nr:hypothetical protein [Oscillospiraceae bacterium]